MGKIWWAAGDSNSGPLIKSPIPAKLQPTPTYCSEENPKIPLVAFVAVRTEGTDTKRTQISITSV
jgi:hypothetical protein